MGGRRQGLRGRFLSRCNLRAMFLKEQRSRRAIAPNIVQNSSKTERSDGDTALQFFVNPCNTVNGETGTGWTGVFPAFLSLRDESSKTAFTPVPSDNSLPRCSCFTAIKRTQEFSA